MSWSVLGICASASACWACCDARLRLGNVGVSRGLEQLLELGLVALQALTRRDQVRLGGLALRLDRAVLQRRQLGLGGLHVLLGESPGSPSAVACCASACCRSTAMPVLRDLIELGLGGLEVVVGLFERRRELRARGRRAATVEQVELRLRALRRRCSRRSPTRRRRLWPCRTRCC